MDRSETVRYRTRVNRTLVGVHTVPVIKRSVAERVPDMVSVHTRNTTFEEVSAPEQNCMLYSAVENGTLRIGQLFEMVRVNSEHFYRSKTCIGK